MIQVTGQVAERPAGMANPKLATGEIELRVTGVQAAQQEPHAARIAECQCAGPAQRRAAAGVSLSRSAAARDAADAAVARPHREGHARLFRRARILSTSKRPCLGRSTPEGARDYLVPSRVSQGSFYALPQSPQLYKQILMMAGYDRYVQVARCFRDEDLRADRQPEFTQLDLEMSFVDADDVIGMIDGLVQKLAKKMLGLDVKLPLPRMTYDEAMERFGHDAPDLRFGLELVDCTDLAAKSDFRVFSSVAASGGRVRADQCEERRRALFAPRHRCADGVRRHGFGAKGLAWFKVEADGTLQSTIAKNFSPELLKEFGDPAESRAGRLAAVRGRPVEGHLQGAVRAAAEDGAEMKLYDPQDDAFFVGRRVSRCSTSTTRKSAGWRCTIRSRRRAIRILRLLESDPGKCRAKAYDLVINGSEAGGGTIRIHDPVVQQQVFSLLGIDEKSAEERFGFLLRALKYGAPPHGGIALGIDRWVMLFGGLDNIRDCIAFPKTQRASDLMTGAPGAVEPKQLKELGIKLNV